MTDPMRVARESDQRDRWSKGLVRHLRLDEHCPPGQAFALRLERNGGLDVRGGSEDIHYTLVVAPKHAENVEKIRRQLEEHPGIGGPFSPERDLGELDQA